MRGRRDVCDLGQAPFGIISHAVDSSEKEAAILEMLG